MGPRNARKRIAGAIVKAALSLLPALVVGAIWGQDIDDAARAALRFVTGRDLSLASTAPWWHTFVIAAAYEGVYVLALCPLSVLTFALLSRARATDDGETHCRRCGYILRGLSQARCPECGETV